MCSFWQWLTFFLAIIALILGIVGVSLAAQQSCSCSSSKGELVWLPHAKSSEADQTVLRYALVAVDGGTIRKTKSRYRDYWPMVREAWARFNIQPVCIYVGDDIPHDWKYQEDVMLFKPIAGVSTVFTAQCIRLLAPAMLPDDGQVVISDMDIVPMCESFFRARTADATSDTITHLLPSLQEYGMLPMGYVSGTPEAWRKMMKMPEGRGLTLLNAIRKRLTQWYAANHDWFADQHKLYEHFRAYPYAVECGAITDFHRIDRKDWLKMTEDDVQQATDAHLPPYSSHVQKVWNQLKATSE